MAMHYCFELNGRKICIHMPVLYDRFWWLKPQPDPWTVPDFTRPDPTPWKDIGVIMDELVPATTRQDLTVLAQIDALAAQLSEKNRERFRNVTQEALEQMDLPKDVAVRIG
jgi:hypothetical protein